MSDTFSLKWNDFERNVSMTFDLLRSEEEFFDVSLVTDDQKTMSAHRLVLSASSPYFKNVLTGNKHSHPILCLMGVDSENLKTLLDYIYTGEVKVYEENLEKFLSISEKLQLEGLTPGSKADKSFKEETRHSRNEYIEPCETFSHAEEHSVKKESIVDMSISTQSEPELSVAVPKESAHGHEIIREVPKPVPSPEKFEDSEAEVNGYEMIREVPEPVPSPEKCEDITDISLSENSSLRVDSSDPESVERKILEQMTSLGAGEYRCRVCGKVSKGKSARTIMRQHIETHLEGLSYPCQHCDRTCRTRNALRAHKSSSHRTSL